MKFTIDEFLEKLPLPANEKWKDGVFDVEPFKKANVTLVFFAPRGTDYQTFHEEDEFYFIVRGLGVLVIETEKFNCETGDIFFVPAKKIIILKIFPRILRLGQLSSKNLISIDIFVLSIAANLSCWKLKNQTRFDGKNCQLSIVNC